MEDFVDYVNCHPEVKWISSKVNVYSESFDASNCKQKGLVFDRRFFDKSVIQQLEQIAWQNVIIAPSLFYNIDFKRLIGGYDDSYGYEDYPFYLKALENGYKCYFLDKETVGYRVHQSQYHSSGKLFNYSFLRKERLFIKERCFAYLTIRKRFLRRSLWLFQDLIEVTGLNRNKPLIIGKLYKAFESMTLKLAK